MQTRTVPHDKLQQMHTVSVRAAQSMQTSLIFSTAKSSVLEEMGFVLFRLIPLRFL